jgi:hypothetical protein
MTVSEGSKGEHVIVSGTVIRTLPPTVGAPTVIVMSALATAAVEPANTAAAAATRMVRVTICIYKHLLRFTSRDATAVL